jgi:hypothetical protein
MKISAAHSSVGVSGSMTAIDKYSGAQPSNSIIFILLDEVDQHEHNCVWIATQGTVKVLCAKGVIEVVVRATAESSLVELCEQIMLKDKPEIMGS